MNHNDLFIAVTSYGKQFICSTLKNRHHKRLVCQRLHHTEASGTSPKDITENAENSEGGLTHAGGYWLLSCFYRP